MFDEIVTRYPESISRESLAEYVGLSSNSGTFGTYLSILRSNSLIDVENREIKASMALFL